MDTNIKRIPPQALEIEEAVLGAIMIEKGAIDEAFSVLDSPEYFYKDSHKMIYGAILKLYHEDRPIDILTVSDTLSKEGEINEVGGRLFITQLSGRVSTAIHIQEYCQIIKEAAIKRSIIVLGVDIIKSAYDISSDVEGLLSQANHGLDQAIESLHGKSLFRPFSYYLQQSIKNLEEREKMAKIGKISGIPTPILGLTKMTYGWKPGDLIIIAARPSMGKTAFALSSAVIAAENNFNVNIYSLEMKGERLSDRVICGLSGVDIHKYKSGLVNAEDWQKLEETITKLEKLPIYIDDYPVPTMDYIKSQSRINKRKGLCDLIIIDYLQLTNTTRTFNQNREQEVSAMSRKAKLMAMELSVPVILLSQLNRACELRGGLKRPQLSDLRESGAIEQDADTVLMLYRPEVYDITEDDNGNSNKGRGEIIVAKQRDGMVGNIDFGYNESMTKIYDLNTTQYEIPIKQKKSDTIPF